jgi:single-stranded-DNA-specific exonuclease
MHTTILSHGDTDGMCSAAIALSRFPDAQVFFTRPVSFLSDLRETRPGRIIIADIALNRKEAPEAVELFRQLSAQCEIHYFDHHTLQPRIKKQIREAIAHLSHTENVSASELIYRHFQKEIPRERVWVALYGAIGDYSDETPFARERILNWDRRALYFEVSTIAMGIKNEEFCKYDAKRRIVAALSAGKNPTDIPGLVKSAKRAINREFELYEQTKGRARKSGKVGYVLDQKSFGFRGPSALFSATVTNSPLGLYVFTREKYIDITARTRDYSLKLNKLMEEASERVGGSGGGHAAAAGAKIPKGRLKEFLEELNKLF